MQATKYLLLVIDLLNDYFHQQAPLATQRSQLVASVNRLAASFRKASQPIIRVRQEFAPDLSDAFLRARRTPLSRPDGPNATRSSGSRASTLDSSELTSTPFSEIPACARRVP